MALMSRAKLTSCPTRSSSALWQHVSHSPACARATCTGFLFRLYQRSFGCGWLNTVRITMGPKPNSMKPAGWSTAQIMGQMQGLAHVSAHVTALV